MPHCGPDYLQTGLGIASGSDRTRRSDLPMLVVAGSWKLGIARGCCGDTPGRVGALRREGARTLLSACALSVRPAPNIPHFRRTVDGSRERPRPPGAALNLERKGHAVLRTRCQRSWHLVESRPRRERPRLSFITRITGHRASRPRGSRRATRRRRAFLRCIPSVCSTYPTRDRGPGVGIPN